MLTMRIDTMVAAIVRQELYGKGRTGWALHFSFDCGLGYYNCSPQSYSVRRGLHLLYYLSPHETYITVFSGVTESPFTEISKVEWKFETHHDSCWRDIRVFSDVYFEMADDINRQLVEDGYTEVAPRDMEDHTTFAGILSHAYNWLPVKVIVNRYVNMGPGRYSVELIK